MKRLLAVFLLCVCSVSALAFQPRTGTWWNPNEPGTAYNIEIQNGTLIVTVYSYQAGGAAQWYLASGTLAQQTFTGTLDKYAGGQCISCTFTGPPALLGNDGSISIAFATETTALVTLPGGRTAAIQPFNFGIGTPPNGLVGEWVFIYDAGTVTNAQRVDLTTHVGMTAAGNGVVADLPRGIGCELQVTGGAAGAVLCVKVDSMGNVLNGYLFLFGLDETYSGAYLSAAGQPLYAMKGFKVVSAGGISRRMPRPGDDASAIGTNAAGDGSAPTAGAVAQALIDSIGRMATATQ